MCTECGLIHSNWPALAYSSPSYYNDLSDIDKSGATFLDRDFCMVQEEDNTFYFIRVVLIQKVLHHPEDLHYGLWTSLSEKSFRNYERNFNNENHQEVYFGWLSSSIPRYDFSEPVPLDVINKSGSSRPEIIPHRDSDHQFALDYYQGITSHEAQRRVDEMVKSLEE